MLIERFGGSHGVRDLGLVESALYRPQSGYYETLPQQAAALIQSFAMNHAFVDGNKRVAFAIGAVFIRLNGYRLKATPDESERFMIDTVIQSKADVALITQWIEAHIIPVS